MRVTVIILLRALAALSLMLAPLGMPAATAAQPSAAEAATGHCAGHGEPGKASPLSERHCAACAAIPAADPPLSVAAAAPRTLPIANAGPVLPGLEIETATPPPRNA